MSEVVQIFQQGLWSVIVLSALPVAVAVVAGVLVSVLQTLLSVQDQSLPFAVKLVAVGLTLAAMGRWIGLQVLALAHQAFTLVPSLAVSATESLARLPFG